ncbi:MAG: hypothetical protein ACUVV0_06355 [Anaerolineae bacterium]
MFYTITLSQRTYELLESRARQEGYSVEQLAEMLLQEQLKAVVGMKGVLRQALGLSEEEWADLIARLHSASELRAEISKYIPPGVKLSEEILAMREE